jgi:hypothetical protein
MGFFSLISNRMTADCRLRIADSRFPEADKINIKSFDTGSATLYYLPTGPEQAFGRNQNSVQVSGFGGR